MKLAAHSGTLLSPGLVAVALLSLSSCAEQIDPSLDDIGLTQDATQASALPDAGLAQLRDAASTDAKLESSAQPAPKVAFSAKLQSDYVMVDFTGGPVYVSQCSGVQLEKLEGTGWTSLRDDTRSANHGYFLDGVYRPPVYNPGCDFDPCIQVTRINAGAALEYVQTGTRPLEAGGPALSPGLSADNPAPEIKTRPYLGKLRATISFARAALPVAVCGPSETVQLELDVPAGSCCPVSTSCSSTNAGGWTASPDECASRAFQDGSFTPAKDAHGCDVLHTSTSGGAMCCGCLRSEGTP